MTHLFAETFDDLSLFANDAADLLHKTNQAIIPMSSPNEMQRCQYPDRIAVHQHAKVAPFYNVMRVVSSDEPLPKRSSATLP